MTNNFRIATSAVLLLLAMIVLSCVQDNLILESQSRQPSDFTLADARKNYEGNIKNLSLPEILLKPIIQTKGNDFFHSVKQTPLWEKYHFVENDWSYTYEIPILFNIPVIASMGQLTKEGKMHKERKDVRLQTNLIIQKYKKSGNIHFFLTTIIGYIPNPEDETHDQSPWLWTGDRSNFTGYQFFTNTDGSYRSAFQYKDSKRWNISLNIYDKDAEYNYPQDVFIINFGQNTKSIDDDKYCDICDIWVDESVQFCPDCGVWLEALEGIIITPGVEYCELCGQWIELCMCENNSGHDVCPKCLNPDCNGECPDKDGEGSGGGGNTPGPGADPEPEPEPEKDTCYTVTLKVIPDDSGSISGPTTCLAGTSITLEAIPTQDYIFAYWSGDLSGSNNPGNIIVEKNISVTANLFHKDSECGKLFKNYNNNSLLANALENYNSIFPDATKNKIEHGYYPFNGVLQYINGNESSVVIPANKGVLSFFTHNHPSDALIPSIEDILGVYKTYKNGVFTEGSSLIIVTNNGSIGVEVSNINVLEDFLRSLNLLNLEGEDLKKACREYNLVFNSRVLDNPTRTQIKDNIYTELSILFYMQHGLKFAHRFCSDPVDRWNYAKPEGGSLTFNNCLTF